MVEKFIRQSTGEHMRVLIVEDDTMMAEALKDRLERHEIEVVVARTKAEVTERFTENPDFYAILFDGWLDGATDTCALIAHIRQTYKGHMIAMSSRDDTRQVQLVAGCNHESWNKNRAARLVIDLLVQEHEGAQVCS